MAEKEKANALSIVYSELKVTERLISIKWICSNSVITNISEAILSYGLGFCLIIAVLTAIVCSCTNMLQYPRFFYCYLKSLFIIDWEDRWFEGRVKEAV